MPETAITAPTAPRAAVATAEVECYFEKTTIPVGEYANLRSVLRVNGINPHAYHTKLLNCQGFGVCGTCIVEILDGMENLTPKTFLENFWLDGAPPSYRLSCQCKVLKGKVTVITDPKTR